MGWVHLANDNTFEFMCGGVEGAPADAIVRNALRFSRANKADLNLLSLGWHSKHDIKLIEKLLHESENIPNLAFLTLPSSMDEIIASQDVSGLFLASNSADEAYMFWGNHIYSVHEALKLVKEINYQNELMRRYAISRGIPILDLENIYNPSLKLENFRLNFFDLGHPRPSFYPKLSKDLHNFARYYIQ